MFNLRIDMTGIDMFSKEPQQLDRDVANVIEWFNRGKRNHNKAQIVPHKVTKSGWVWRDYEYKGWLNPPEKRKIMQTLKNWGYVILNWPNPRNDVFWNKPTGITLGEPQPCVLNNMGDSLFVGDERLLVIDKDVRVIHNVIKRGIKNERELAEQITTMQKRIMKLSEQLEAAESDEYRVTVGNSYEQKQAMKYGQMTCVFHNNTLLMHFGMPDDPTFFCPRLDCGFSITLGVSDYQG